MSVKLTYVLIIVIVIAALGWGLVSYSNLLKARSELNAAAEAASTLRMLIGTLETDLERTEQDLASVRQELRSTQSKLDQYEDAFGSPVFTDILPPWGAHIASYDTATDPTWVELLEFIQSDRTDQHAYVEGHYVCMHFAMALHNNAERAGIRAAYVVVEFPGTSHALNAFKTTDRGLVFIDCTGATYNPSGISHDKLAHVEKGDYYAHMYLFPESDWHTASEWGIVSKVTIYW
jgi:hypothetical protein